MIRSLLERSQNRANSTDVANLLLAEAQQRGDTLTPMQLLKLVYLCHAWMLGLYGKPLISDEIEAWRYGPVIRELYDKIKRFRSNAVEPPISGGTNHVFNEREADLIKEVYEKYGNRSGVKLSALTHKKGSPWQITWETGGRDGTISNDLIEHYYSKIADEAV